MTVITNTRSRFTSASLMFPAKSLVYLGTLCLMLCVPLLNASYVAAMVMVLVSGSWIKHWRILLKDKIIIMSLIFVFLLTLSLTYTTASHHIGWRVWDKYMKIFYLLFFIPFFIDKRSRNIAIVCLIASVMISEVFSYLKYFDISAFGYEERKHWLFVQDIDAGYVVSLTCYFLVNIAIDNKKYRWLCLLCLGICSFNMLFMNEERTGYIIYLALTGLFLLQRLRLKGVLVGLIMIPLFFCSLYFTSSIFHYRTNLFVKNIIDFHNGTNQISSIGLRLIFAQYSIKLLEGHWIMGRGVGSFEEGYRGLNAPKMNDLTWPAHPHDEYIDILLQTGVIGLACFLLWVSLQIQASFSLPRQEKFFLQATILGFLMISFCNASLLVNPAGACYMTFIAVFLSAKFEGKLKLPHNSFLTSNANKQPQLTVAGNV